MRIDPLTLAAWDRASDEGLGPRSEGRPSAFSRPWARLPMALRWLVLAMMMAPCGCSERDGAIRDLTGPEALARLPKEVAALVPADSILRLDEDRPDDAYRLWILHRPGGSPLAFEPKPRGMDQHQMPPSALEAILQTRLPSLERGRPLEPHCRFTHWRLADGAEIQIRELVTEQGWFASVERVAL